MSPVSTERDRRDLISMADSNTEQNASIDYGPVHYPGDKASNNKNERLDVVFLYCLADDRFTRLREQWTTLIDRVIRRENAIPIPTRPVYVQFDLDNILHVGREALFDALGKLESWLRDEKAARGTKARRAIKLLGRKRDKNPGFVRYLFIADELASWMIRDVMFRYSSDLYCQTVGVISLGIWRDRSVYLTKQDTPPTSTSSHGSSRQSQHRTYLRALQSLFGVPLLGESWTDDQLQRDLTPWLELVEETFTNTDKLTWIAPYTWQITTKYRKGFGRPGSPSSVPTLLNVTDLEADLGRLFFVCQKLAKKEADLPGHNHDSILSIRHEHADDAKTRDLLGGVTPATEHYEIAGAESTLGPTSPRRISPASTYNLSTSQPEELPSQRESNWKMPIRTSPTIHTHDSHSPDVSSSSSEASLFFRDMRDHAEEYLLEGDLKAAVPLFDGCKKILATMEHPWEDAKLEIDINYAVARLHLGHYDEARCSLHHVVRAAKQLRSQAKTDVEQEEFRCIEKEAVYRYATALTRLGNYDEAVSALDEVVRLEEGDNPTVEASTYSRPVQRKHRVVLVGAYRLRALVSVYLGDFAASERYLSVAERACNDLAQHMRIDGIDERRDLQYRTTECAIAITRAKMLIIEGEFERAQAVVRPALEDLDVNVGYRNALTLEAAILNSLCLVSTSNVNTGEALCLEASKLLSDTFDKRHPLSMEATYVLVCAYRAQGRVEEALGTSRHLCLMAEASPAFGSTIVQRARHSQTLKYNSQLGALEVYIGNYLEAEQILARTHEQATFKWSREHPNTLRFLSELAWARVHMQKLREAENNILEALLGQLVAFMPSTIVKREGNRESMVSLVENNNLIDGLRTKLSAKRRSSTEILHPDLFFTLFVASQIEAKKPTPNLDFVCRVTTIVHEYFQARFGDGHEWTLAATLAAGNASSAFGHSQKSNEELFLRAQEYFDAAAEQSLQRKRKASEKLASASQQHLLQPNNEESTPPPPSPQFGDYNFTATRDSLGSHIDKTHPLILCAERDSVLASILAGRSSDDDMRRARRRLDEVLTMQRRKPGPNHPDTLQTLLSLVSVRMALGDLAGADRTKDDLLKRLRDPHIRKQRCAETLLMEERIAYIYFGAGEVDVCRELLEALTLALTKLQGEGGLDAEVMDALSALSKRVKASLGVATTESEALEEESAPRGRAGPEAAQA